MEQQNIVNRLDRIEAVLKSIQENLSNEDVVLSEEEKRLLDESLENEKLGKLVSLDKIKDVRDKTR